MWAAQVVTHRGSARRLARGGGVTGLDGGGVDGGDGGIDGGGGGIGGMYSERRTHGPMRTCMRSHASQ